MPPEPLVTRSQRHCCGAGAELLALSGEVCAGVDSLSECEEAHQQVACAWLTNHTNVWEDFIPEQAHCSKGEFVRKEGSCSAGAHTTDDFGPRVVCLCRLGRVFTRLWQASSCST